MIALLLKVTLLFAVALCSLPLLRRSTAAMRHLVCAISLGGALLLPMTLLYMPRGIAVRVPLVFRATASAIPAATTLSLSRVLLSVWVLGTAMLLLRLAIGYWRMAGMTAAADHTADHSVDHIAGAAPVYLADVSVPVVVGLFRPAILLPRDSDSWPMTQRAAALRHELAHLDRQDLFTSLIAHLTCALYWFHPLAWAVAHRLRHEQEIAADDAVLSAGFEPATYAEALVATARNLTSTTLIGCHMLNTQTIKTRIARLLDSRLPRQSSTTALRRAAVLSVALLAVIGLAYAEPQAKPAAETILKIGPGITSPKLLQRVEPTYTEEARAAKIDGTVLLKVVIGTDGMAHDINVVSTPDAGLGGKAVEAVEQWKFQPATKDGEPVSVYAQIEVNFKIR